MKENGKLLSILYLLLEDELSAINQHIVYSERCEKQNISKLLKANRKAMNAMRHAEWLIKRIICIDGASKVSKLIALKFDKTGSELFKMEEGHIDWVEMQQLQTVRMNMGKYSYN